jgi:hypothetical protein
MRYTEQPSFKADILMLIFCHQNYNVSTIVLFYYQITIWRQRKPTAAFCECSNKLQSPKKSEKLLTLCVTVNTARNLLNQRVNLLLLLSPFVFVPHCFISGQKGIVQRCTMHLGYVEEVVAGIT